MATAWALVGLSAASGRGELTPVGEDIPVSESGALADASMSADGGFIVLWTNDEFVGASARRFDPEGMPVDPPIAVDDAHATFNARSAMAPDGRFVIVWDPLEGVTAQRFTAGGDPEGPKILVAPSGYARDVAIAPSGDFVVAWSFDGDVLARRYNAEGDVLGDVPVTDHAGTLESAEAPAVAVAPDGRFAVAWESFSAIGGFPERYRSNVWLRLYDASGEPATDAISVTPGVIIPGIGTNYPHVAFSALGDAILVTWSAGGLPGQLFGSDGSRRGDVFPLTPWYGGLHSIASAPGGFATAYPDLDLLGEGPAVLRSVGTEGELGDPVHVADEAWGMEVATSLDDDLVVAWQDPSDGIRARRFAVPEPPGRAAGLAALGIAGPLSCAQRRRRDANTRYVPAGQPRNS